MSKSSCKKQPMQERLGWGVKESIQDETRILKRNIRFSGKDKFMLVKRVMLPGGNLVAESKTGNCAKASRDYFRVWELYATDIYRRQTSTKAKSPYFFSYTFHHDGIIVETFAGDGKEPAVTRHHKSFDNAGHHWDGEFHPFVQNHWVYLTMCESENTPLPPHSVVL